MVTSTLATLAITKGLDKVNKRRKMAQCMMVNGSKIRNYMELRFIQTETFTQAVSKMVDVMDKERIQKPMVLSTKEFLEMEKSMAQDSSQMLMEHTKQVNFKMTIC